MFGDDMPASARAINRLVNQVVRRPLLAGNRVRVLDRSADAYDAMVAAIDNARCSVTLCTYIFDNDAVGCRFIAALTDAVARGIAVRVLIDAVGVHYSWFNPVDRELAANGVRVARFLPPRLWPLPVSLVNLRNHRKILVVDGEIGFTGGMNIRAGYLQPHDHPQAIIDLHFEVRGPVVSQLQHSFREDWLFVTGEELSGDTWFPPLTSCGATWARGISDSPDEDLDKLFWSYLAAVQGAQRRIHILTPYFLPGPTLVSALNSAVMRGVEVNIVLPERSNLPPVDWAASGILEELLVHGCRTWLTPPPFDHGKLCVVDDAWSLVGSGNWDPRSIKFNFEFSLECYDPVLARSLRHLLEDRLTRGRELSLAELRSRPWFVRLRDRCAALFKSYL